MKRVILLLWICFFSISSVCAENSKHNFVPENGLVSDENTAIKIAEAVLLPIYGESINNKKPFVAKLVDGVWIVEGTLPRNMKGGVPLIEISKDNGAILRVSHGK